MLDEDQFFSLTVTGVPHPCRVLYARLVQILFFCAERKLRLEHRFESVQRHTKRHCPGDRGWNRSMGASMCVSSPVFFLSWLYVWSVYRVCPPLSRYEASLDAPLVSHALPRPAAMTVISPMHGWYLLPQVSSHLTQSVIQST